MLPHICTKFDSFEHLVLQSSVEFHNKGIFNINYYFTYFLSYKSLTPHLCEPMRRLEATNIERVKEKESEWGKCLLTA